MPMLHGQHLHVNHTLYILLPPVTRVRKYAVERVSAGRRRRQCSPFPGIISRDFD